MKTDKYGLIIFEDDDFGNLPEYSKTMNAAIIKALNDNQGDPGPEGPPGPAGGVNSINGLQGDIVEKHYTTTLTENLITTELELPASYKVGTNCLQVYFEGDLLEKDIHYEEVGEPNSISNKIKIDWLTNWKEETGEEELIFSFIVQGTYEEV